VNEREVKRLLHEVLVEYKAINDEIHSTHHAFIEMMIKKEERKQERMEKIKTQVGGWAVILLLGFLGKAVWDFVEKQIK